MRQLMHRDCRPGRACVVEELAPHLVVSTEVVHRREERAHIDDVAETAPDGAEDVPDVLDHSSGLGADVETHRAHVVDIGSRDRVVWVARRGA